ncbi:MAG: STAS domain-containing protein [Cyanobacteriota bacterium ELA615]|jgi:anti-anti-sigma factor
MQSSIKVVKPYGIMDGTQSSQFRHEISSLLEDSNSNKSILIDFQDVTFMDSSGLGTLVLCLKSVRTAGAELYVCSVNEQIKMLLELTSMDKVFEIYSSAEELEKKLSQKAV